MHFHLDHHSGEPIYRQIVETIKYRIASAQMAEGDTLPSIRALADQLKINTRTVVKAYEELQHAGLVVMKQGQGVFVSVNHGVTPAGVRRKAIADLARRLLAEASRLGAEPRETIEIVKDEADKLELNR